MTQSLGKKAKNTALGMYLFTAIWGGTFLYFGFQEARYSLFGVTTSAKVTHKTSEWRSHKGGSHQVFVLDYSFRDKDGKEKSGHDEVHSRWSFGPDETVQVEYIPGADVSSRVKGAKNIGILLWISGVSTSIGGLIVLLLRRHQSKAAVELEPLTQSESSKADDSSADRTQQSERKHFAPGVPKFSDEALVSRCAGWMGKPVSVIVDRAKGLIHFQNCFTRRKFLALSAEPWFSCPLSELTATHHYNNKGTQSLVIVTQSGKAWISAEATNYSALCETMTELLPGGGQGFSVEHPAMAVFYVFAAFGGFFLGWYLTPKGVSDITLGLVIVGSMIVTFVVVYQIVSRASSMFKAPSVGRSGARGAENSPRLKRLTDPQVAGRRDSWVSDVPSTTTNSTPLVVKISGSSGLVACLLLILHFAIAKPTPVAVGTAAFLTQAPIQPVTPVPVTPLASTTPVTPLATPVAQPLPPKPVANWKGWPKEAPPPAIAPFNAEQAKQHQEAWAKHLGVPVEYTNSIGMKFRLIPPGEYLRGSTKAEIDALIGTKALPDLQSEMPQHKVIVTEAIYFGIHEVTQKQYLTMMGINPSFFTRTGGGKGAIGDADTSDLPVDTVSWLDAGKFCTKLSEHEKLAPFDLNPRGPAFPTGNGYRLPTEAQWEFACRAGTQTRYWTGDSKIDVRRAGVFTSPSTRPVGSLAANAFGLFDVHGNVWEWCLDGWNPDAYQPFRDEIVVDPLTLWNQLPKRALRGAHFYYGPDNGRSAGREKAPQTMRYLDNGFRAALSVAGVKAALANPVKAEASSMAINGKELRRFDGHQGPVWKAVFSADGKRVLSGSGFPNGDSTMRLWDVEAGRELRQFRNDGTNRVFGVALSHDGKQALSGNAVGISLWDVETGAVLRRMDFDSKNKTVLTVAFAPDGKRAVSGGSDHVVRLWELASGAEIRTLTGHLGRVMSVAFSPDGSQIASCGLDEDKTVRLWNTETGNELLRLEGHTAGVESVAFTPDGSRIVSSAFDGLMLWDAKAGKLIRKIVGDGTDILEAVFFPDGRRVLSGGNSGRVSIWDSETGQELQRLAEGSEWVWTVAVSPDGLRGVSAGGSSNINGKWVVGEDFAIRLWSLADINASSK